MDKNFDLAGLEGQDVAKAFVNAIKNEDAPLFWKMLDKKGQGYFMGMWFLALANADIRTIEGLSGEGTFLANALRPIMENLKNYLGDFMESFSFGKIVYIDSHHARVPFLSTTDEHKRVGGQEKEESIPLVLELAPVDDANTALTCWKVDTFECIQFRQTNY